MTPDITPVANDELRVCLTRDGQQVCATVSSAHLVSDKLKQLEVEMPMNYLMVAPMSNDSFLRFTKDVLPHLV